MMKMRSRVVADVTAVRVGPLVLMPPFVVVRLGQSLSGNESHTKRYQLSVQVCFSWALKAQVCGVGR